jgi:hypothetical protein
MVTAHTVTRMTWTAALEDRRCVQPAAALDLDVGELLVELRDELFGCLLAQASGGDVVVGKEMLTF